MIVARNENDLVRGIEVFGICRQNNSLTVTMEIPMLTYDNAPAVATGNKPASLYSVVPNYDMMLVLITQHFN